MPGVGPAGAAAPAGARALSRPRPRPRRRHRRGPRGGRPPVRRAGGRDPNGGVVGDGPEQPGTGHDVASAHRAVRGARARPACPRPGTARPRRPRPGRTAGGRRRRRRPAARRRARTRRRRGHPHRAPSCRPRRGSAASARRAGPRPARPRGSAAGLGRRPGTSAGTGGRPSRRSRSPTSTGVAPVDEAVGRGRRGAQPPAQLGDAHRHVGSFVAPRGCHCADPLPDSRADPDSGMCTARDGERETPDRPLVAGLTGSVTPFTFRHRPSVDQHDLERLGAIARRSIRSGGPTHLPGCGFVRRDPSCGWSGWRGHATPRLCAQRCR